MGFLRKVKWYVGGGVLNFSIELANGSHSSSRRVRLCTLVLLGGHLLLTTKITSITNFRA